MPEFIKAIDQQCKGKSFDAFPEAFKFWINCSFRTIDVDGELWYNRFKKNKSSLSLSENHNIDSTLIQIKWIDYNQSILNTYLVIVNTQ